MIIDFHTHIFPDRIAAAALTKLSDVIHLKPSMNGTIDGLRASMEHSGIDLSVILPCITDPHQHDSIIRFASFINENYSQISGPRLISFAGIHPDADNYKEKLLSIKHEGFKGVKIHPNYQGRHFDDIRYMRILYTASELDLCVLTHAGSDPYTPEEDYCTPDMILKVVHDVAPTRLILAHMGSNEHYQESEEKLCGQNVYFDTAYSILHMAPEQLERMIHFHGTDRILFGSDAPWAHQKDCAERMASLKTLLPEEKEKIFSGNAATLLGLS